MLIGSLMAMLGPYELGPDSISRVWPKLRMLQIHPWESGALMGKEWVRMAGFALIGALAIRMAVSGRRKPTIQRPLAAASLVLILPVILECARLLVESNSPSLSDLSLDMFAALAGGFASLFVPQAYLAFSGFLLFNVALIAAGLSPYRFSSWPTGASFQWIPFYEFCSDRTPSAFYDSTLTLFTSAILGGLLQLSFPRCKGQHVAAYALIFSGTMQFAHVFLPAHHADITGILVAGLGAWTGAYFCAAVESARLSQTGLLKPDPH
jgi:hypothetical protein